jgi:hypothetical protein
LSIDAATTLGIIRQSVSRPIAKFCNSGFPLCMGCAVPIGVAFGDALLRQGAQRVLFCLFCWPPARSPAAS